MAQPAKDGYEAAPLLNQAEAGVQTPEWQPEQPAPRTWHGSLFACCGPSCDALGWTTCLVTHYLPAVTFGVNSRKAHGKSALRAGLLFATLMFLSWAHYAAQVGKSLCWQQRDFSQKSRVNAASLMLTCMLCHECICHPHFWPITCSDLPSVLSSTLHTADVTGGWRLPG